MTVTSLVAVVDYRTGKIIKNVFERGKNLVYYIFVLRLSQS